jgi:putative ABC transport system substrate-binding protein
LRPDARAQQPGKIYRVGLLTTGATIGAGDERRKTLLSVLAARGFVEGQNLVFVQRSADAHPKRLDGLAAELKAANVDVIVTFGYPAALAAKISAKDVPIVVTGAGVDAKALLHVAFTVFGAKPSGCACANFLARGATRARIGDL